MTYKTTISFLLLSVSFLVFTQCKKPSNEELYDQDTAQEPVYTHEGIDLVLSQFPLVSYNELDPAYISYSESDGSAESVLKSKFYYQIQGKEVLNYIVGKQRIAQFLSTDEYFIENRENYNSEIMQYWLVDPKMLHTLLDVLIVLEKKGYNPEAVEVRESHRHPKFNAFRQGASTSQHVYGTAVDLTINDIDEDGDSDWDDKVIVIDIIEELIGDEAGIGRYPATQTVHFDTRGWKARWDAM